MAGSGIGTGLGLVGRQPERQLIDDLLTVTATGESRSLVLCGPAGIGKSALLRYAETGATDRTVLRTSGVEVESDLAFAGLHGLLRAIAGHLPQLPHGQAEAMAAALALGETVDVDRLLVGAATVSLLAAAADERPVVCLVDDLQWVDAASANALLFAARRLRAEPVALLFASRDGINSAAASDLDQRELPGLPISDAAQLLQASAPGAATSVLDWLLSQAAGNPLALLELPGTLSAAQLQGTVPLPEALTLTARLQFAFAERGRYLLPNTRQALVIASLEEDGDAAVVLRACAEAGLPADSLDPAEENSLVRVMGGTIEFCHPLARAALAGSATLSQRRRAHSALASVLTGEQQQDRRAWHRALAALDSDEEAADALDLSAGRAADRGAHSAAATALARAAELSAEGDRRTDRRRRAAQAAWTAGESDRARALIAVALPLARGMAHAELLRLRGVIEGRTGDVRRAIEILVEAEHESDDASLTLDVLAEAVEYAVYAGDLEQATRLARRALTVSPQDDTDRFRVAALGGLAAALAGDHQRAGPMLAEAISLAELMQDPALLTLAARLAGLASTHGDGLVQATRAVTITRERGLVSLLPAALREQSTALIGRGRFDAAYAAAEEALQLASDFGQRWGASWTLANLASLDALRGNEPGARAHAREALELASASGALLVAGFAERALGLLDLTLGRLHQATERFLPLATPGSTAFHPVIAMWTTPDLIEAAARADRLEEVGSHLDRYADWAHRPAAEPRISLLARCRALARLGDPREGFELAVEHGETLSLFQQGRTELLFGEWLRRQRHPAEARGHLRKAEELFRLVGTHPWAERAQGELRATGETVPRRDASTLEELTPQELQIVGLVSTGLTNRQIAAQLFLSPRTVEYHLRKVFIKLNVTSRVELARIGSQSPARGSFTG